MTSDPKAIQHIYVNSNTFVRQNNNRELLGMVVGPGIGVVNGDAHKRQRRIMQPAFGVSHIKALFANVMHHVAKVVVVFSSLIIDLRWTGVAFDCGEEGNRCRRWSPDSYYRCS